MADERTLLEVLAATRFGAALPSEARRQLAALAELRELAPGSTVLREGDETSALGIVHRGRLALQVLVPERGAITILTVGPGDLIGWSAIIPPYRATSSVVAVEPTTLVAVDAPRLRSRLASDEPFAAAVYPILLQAVSQRLGATRTQLLDLYAHEREAVPW